MSVNVVDCSANIVQLTGLTTTHKAWLNTHKKHAVFGTISWYQNIAKFEVEIKRLRIEDFFIFFISNNDSTLLAVPLYLKRGTLSIVSNFYTPAQFIFFDDSMLDEFSAWSIFIDCLHRNYFSWSRLYLSGINSIQFGYISATTRNKNIELNFTEHTKNYVVEIDDFNLYWNSRPSIIKNTIARKYKLLKKTRYEVIIKSDITSQDKEHYWSVYSNSWKCSEPNCNFINWLMTEAYENAEVHIGFVYINNKPAAAQVWILSAGVASIFKLAQDKCFDSLSPGSILTYEMIKYATTNNCSKIDFLLGGDPFKELWMNKSLPVYNIEIFNTHSISGKILSLFSKFKKHVKTLIQKVLNHD